jgi:heme-degrading monooxygenase HmoA
MIAVIFEVLPHPHTKQTYLGLAASLRPRLDRIDGFISIERFQSVTDPDKRWAEGPTRLSIHKIQ